MKPSRHLASSAIFSIALAPWLAWRSLLVLAGGALLDLDRYVWYAIRHRTLRLRTAMDRFQGRDRIRGDLRFFHSVEFLVLLGAAGFLHPLVWVFALGVVFHLFLDLFVHKKCGRFVVHFDPSHLCCLTVEWVRGSGRKAATEDSEEQSSGQDA